MVDTAASQSNTNTVQNESIQKENEDNQELMGPKEEDKEEESF